MKVRCLHCEAELDVSANATGVRCDECGREIELRGKEQITCPRCRAKLNAPPTARVLVCGRCRTRIETGAAAAPKKPRPQRSRTETMAGASDRLSGADEETSVMGDPRDLEAERLSQVREAFAPDYHVVSSLGHGGMGAIYKAVQRQPERTVVLKVMLHNRFTAEKYRLRFEREVQAVARLKHPGIVAVYECGQVAGVPYFSMEYVDGCNIKEFVLRERLDKRQVCELLSEVCKAVAYAHSQGVIHRDLKPNNIMVDSEGKPRLLDFGLARLSYGSSRACYSMTETGEIMGTPSYMSPEQSTGRPQDVDTPSDIYSLGVMAYELLTDTLPYRVDRQRPLASLRTLREYIPKRPGEINPKIDSDLGAIVMKCLEKDPDHRYETVDDLIDDLGNYLRGEPVSARPCTSFYYLRKMMWRRRNVVVPVGSAVMFAVVITVLVLWQLDVRGKEARRTASDAQSVVEQGEQERKELERLIKELQDRRGAPDSLSEPGSRYQPAPLSGESARPEVRLAAKVSEGARGIDLLLAQMRFKEARQLLEQVGTATGGLGAGDLSGRVRRMAGGFDDKAWQALLDHCKQNRGDPLAVDRFLAECPGSPHAAEARAMLEQVRRLIQFSEWPFGPARAQERQRHTAEVLGVPGVRSLSLGGGAQMALVLVPAGEFEMGGSGSDVPADQRPGHRVRIINPFYMSATEVTCAQYEAVLGGAPSGPGFAAGTTDGGRLPAAVSYLEARQFCRSLSDKYGVFARLPTEAEWEYACRAGSAGHYSYGDATGPAVHGRFAWYGNDDGGPTRAGSREANAFALADMHGNMLEWCRDWYGERYYRASPLEDPAGPRSGVYRVLRGGSWSCGALEMRSAWRRWDQPVRTRADYGFRVCVPVFTEGTAADARGAGMAALRR